MSLYEWVSEPLIQLINLTTLILSWKNHVFMNESFTRLKHVMSESLNNSLNQIESQK